MHRVLIDNDFRAAIVHGLVRELGEIDAITLRAVGLERAPDTEVLRFACTEGRILVSHDVRTMPQAVYSLVTSEGLRPQVLLVPQRMAIGRAVEEAAVALGAANEGDWESGVIRLPL